jgi:uncharacterized RDD family membrane protein YckC
MSLPPDTPDDAAAPPPPPPPPFSAPPVAAPPIAPPEPADFATGYAPIPVPAGMYYDPNSGLALPEGTQLAPVGRRIGAFFLSIPLIIVTLVIGYVIWGLIVWGRGQTPTLQVLGMRCWRPDENRVAGFGWMALRNIVGRIAEGILGIFTLAASFILLVATKERKCLHDFIGGTVVLRDPNNVLEGR